MIDTLAEQIFSTPAGQLALRELWAESLLVTARRRKDFDINKVSIKNFRKAREDAVLAFKSLNPDKPEDTSLINIWNEMQERNQILAQNTAIQILERQKFIISMINWRVWS